MYYKLKGAVIFIKIALYLLLSRWGSMANSSPPIQILNNAWIANLLPPAISISEYPDCFAPHKVIKDSLDSFK